MDGSWAAYRRGFLRPWAAKVFPSVVVVGPPVARSAEGCMDDFLESMTIGMTLGDSPNVSGLANSFPFAIVRQVIADLVDQFLAGVKKGCFATFLKDLQVRFRPFMKHERA